MEKILLKRTNPFKVVYEKCNEDTSREKLKNLINFPRYIDIELTSKCNFKCLMCPTGTRSLTRKQGFLADDIYFKILGEIIKYKTPIRFVGWGEPTLHPKILDYIREAKKNGILCHINTNGSVLNEELIRNLVGVPIDSIKFSFQGIDRSSYKEIRNIDYYNELLKKIKLFFAIRGDHQLPYMQISTTVTSEDRDRIQAFRKEAEDFVDLDTVGRTHFDHPTDEKKLSEKEIHTLKRLKQQETIIKRHPECAEVFDKFTINWDGTASACCNDCDKEMVIGNLTKNSIAEIWHSEKMDFYRNMLAEMRHEELEVCKRCYDYMSLQIPGLQKL